MCSAAARRHTPNETRERTAARSKADGASRRRDISQGMRKIAGRAVGMEALAAFMQSPGRAQSRDNVAVAKKKQTRVRRTAHEMVAKARTLSARLAPTRARGTPSSAPSSAACLLARVGAKQLSRARWLSPRHPPPPLPQPFGPSGRLLPLPPPMPSGAQACARCEGAMGGGQATTQGSTAFNARCWPRRAQAAGRPLPAVGWLTLHQLRSGGRLGQRRDNNIGTTSQNPPRELGEELVRSQHRKRNSERSEARARSRKYQTPLL